MTSSLRLKSGVSKDKEGKTMVKKTRFEKEYLELLKRHLTGEENSLLDAQQMVRFHTEMVKLLKIAIENNTKNKHEVTGNSSHE
jgi:hypothetical protein